MRPSGVDARCPAIRLALVEGLMLLALLASCGSNRSGVDAASAPADSQPEGTEPVGSRPEGSEPEGSQPVATEPVVYEPVVMATHPHDPEAFTQGLEFADGRLVESTGLVGRSSIRLVDPETGRVINSVAIEEPVFAEGVTVVGDEIWQLTWQDETMLAWSLDTLEPLAGRGYEGEGWGLCAADDRLVMTDGSDRLTFRSRETFEVLDSVGVTEGGRPIDNLNELECVGDRVWANIWQTDRIVSIDPETGTVDGVVDLRPLVPPGVLDTSADNVANGIAYDDATGRFWVTGKRWPVIYEVELRPQP